MWFSSITCAGPCLAALMLFAAPLSAQTADQASPAADAPAAPHVAVDPALPEVPPPQDPSAGPNWGPRCEGGACILSAGLVDGSGRRLVMSVTVALTAAEGPATLTLFLPLGIDLTRGVALGGGRDMRMIPLVTCLPRGCMAQSVLDPVSLDLIASQSAMAAIFHGYGNPEEIRLEMPLAGMAEAVAAAREALAP